MAAAEFEPLTTLSLQTREILKYLRLNRGEFFLRSALSVTAPTLEALIEGKPLDGGLVAGIERWCVERVGR